MNSDFAARLKELREDKGLSQSELADKLGVSRGSISFYENCSRVPDIDVLLSICNLFSISSDYMIGLSDDPKPLPTATQDTGLTYSAIERLDAWNTRYPDGQKGLSALSRLIVYSRFFDLLIDLQRLFVFAGSDDSLELGTVSIPQELTDQIAEYGYQPIDNYTFRRAILSLVERTFGEIVLNIVQGEEHRARERNRDKFKQLKRMSGEELAADFLQRMKTPPEQ